jgi:hypothetical protein
MPLATDNVPMVSDQMFTAGASTNLYIFRIPIHPMCTVSLGLGEREVEFRCSLLNVIDASSPDKSYSENGSRDDLTVLLEMIR